MDEFYLLLPEASKTFATIVPENQEQKSFYLENEQTHSSSLPMVMSMDVPFWFLPRCRREAGGEECKELPSVSLWHFPTRESFLVMALKVVTFPPFPIKGHQTW